MGCSCFKMNNLIIIMFIYVEFIDIPMANCAVPGTFFWKPRLGLDLAIPTTEFSMAVLLPTKDNIQEGLVVLVDGYQAGLSVISIASGISNAEQYPHFNPMSAYFFTNAYRWGLRYVSLIPFWLGGNGGNYCDTHRVWRRRFYYMDEFVPNWLRSALFFVKKEDWEKEELDYKRFKKYAEPAFGKHYRYPAKKFRNYKSQITAETVDEEDASSSSIQF